VQVVVQSVAEVQNFVSTGLGEQVLEPAV